MARTSRDTSSEQKNEGQRDEARTSPNSTALTSNNASSSDAQRITAEENLEQVNAQADKMLGKDDPNKDDMREKVEVKTTGAYMVYDPSTGDSVDESGGEMINTPFVQAQLENGRLIKA